MRQRGLSRPDWQFSFTMFIAGFCLMNIEIIAGLFIAPFFGSSVFVWGSIIAVFMGALGLGYALGGKLAERPARVSVLSLLLFLSGLFVLLVSFIGPALGAFLLGLNAPSPLFNLLPLAEAALLYFIPTLLLGMATPVLVRMGSMEFHKVGSSVGRLYAWNALGSVAGGLTTTFILSALFGNRAILIACALLLMASGFFVYMMVREVETVKSEARKPASPGRVKSVPGLLTLVFVCGMVMMSFEVIAGAEIAPYFGSSVFVWGSVISVFLMAMTLGYKLGGKMVDRRPSMKRLSAIVIMAAFLLLLLPLVTPAICQVIQTLSIGRKGNICRPLLAAAVLFFCPTMLLSMIAPFSVRLVTQRLESLGNVAGRLYSLSTLGNMIGVLLTTFLLIPLVGKRGTLEISGALTLVAALFSLIRYHQAFNLPQPRLVPGLTIILGLVLVLLAKPILVPMADADERIIGSAKEWKIISTSNSSDYFILRRLIEEAESPYHHIAVIDERRLGKGESVVSDQGQRYEARFAIAQPGNLRKLKFNQFTQSAIMLDETLSIRHPLQSGTAYTDMLHLPFVFKPDMRDVLIIGGGAGVAPMIFRQAYPVWIDVVEIDPVVVKVAQKWFGLDQDPRLAIFVQDGRMFLYNTKKLYDLIILDVYSAGDRIPFHLATLEFLGIVRERLKPDGIALINLISAIKGPKSQLFRAELRTFRHVFGADHVYVFPEAISNLAPAEESRNIMLIATGPSYARISGPQFTATARKLVADNVIKIQSIAQHASHMLTEKDLAALGSDAPLLTDDYAPVDMMMVSAD